MLRMVLLFTENKGKQNTEDKKDVRGGYLGGGCIRSWFCFSRAWFCWAYSTLTLIASSI